MDVMIRGSPRTCSPAWDGRVDTGHASLFRVAALLRLPSIRKPRSGIQIASAAEKNSGVGSVLASDDTWPAVLATLQKCRDEITQTEAKSGGV